MIWIWTTLSFRAAVLWGVPSLAGQPVRVAMQPGSPAHGHVWHGDRRLGRVARPSDCRVAGGLPVGRARRLRAERRLRLERAAQPGEHVSWDSSGGQIGAGFGGGRGNVEELRRRPRRFEFELVRWTGFRADGSRLGVVIAAWPIGREVEIGDLEVHVQRRRGLRRVDVLKAELEVEVFTADADGFLRSGWVSGSAWWPGGSTVGRCGCQVPRAIVGAGTRIRVTIAAMRPRGFRPALEVRARLRHVFRQVAEGEEHG